MNSMEKSPFQAAALQFALNNNPGAVSLSALLTAAQAGVTPAPQIPSILLPSSLNFNSQLLKAQLDLATAGYAASSSGVSELSSGKVSSHPEPAGHPAAPIPSPGLNHVQQKVARTSRGCNFCGAIQGQSQRELLECDECQLVKYCSAEHKKFDWKRHKPLCRTAQMRIQRQRGTYASLGASQGLSEPMDSTSSSSASPPNGMNKSSSLHSLTASCSSSGPSSSQYSINALPQERLVETDDPDIKIIENEKSPRKPHKRRMSEERLLNPQGKPYKDHSKNLLFKTTLQDHMRSLAASGLALNQHQAIALRLRYIAEHAIRSLNEYGWAVVDNFLGKTHCRYTHMEIEELYKRGLFTEGQLMEVKDPDVTATKDIRSDQIYWFDSSDPKARDAVTIRLLVSMIDSVLVHFQGRIPPYQIGGRSRAMVACYPGNGSRYVKHVDNPIRDGRCITVIYYCNEDWKLNDNGGTLRLYPETSQVPMDIDPQADRLVFFWSDRRNPHEVMPVFRPRYAVTIWYFDYEEKQRAKERQLHEQEAAQGRKEADASNQRPTQGRRMSSLFSAEDRASINSAPMPQKPSPLRPTISPQSAEISNQRTAFRSRPADSFDEDETDEGASQTDTQNYVPDFEV